MYSIQVRKGVTPDIDILTQFNHSMNTGCVWQMQQNISDSEISTRFIETTLPREMRISYPRSPDLLESRWKDFSVILVACIDQSPVGYAGLNAYFSPGVVWIKDLAVDEMWRKNGVATKLIASSINWAKERGISRIILEMSSKNFPAISLARKLNFEYSGFNDNYFRNQDIAVFFTRTMRKSENG